jgi:hypothetical protein
MCFALFTAKSQHASLMPNINGVVGTAITTKIEMVGAVCGSSTCFGLGGVFRGGRWHDKLITLTYSPR